MTAPARKIVVVEDEPEVRELESFLLESEGYEVVGVPDGESAAPVIREELPALVLLDLMLPHKDGNGVLDDLASDPSTARIPVIVVSAFIDRLRRTSQVRGVLTKPFDPSELLDAVAREIDGDSATAESSVAR
jgi:CheY-like chemotaxis protein